MRIDSPKNEKIQLLRGLCEAKNRQKTGLFVVEGTKMVGEALDAGWPIEFALAEENRFRNETLVRRLTEAGVQLFEAGERAFAAAAQTDGPQGILAAVEMRRNELLWSPVIVLDAVQDPGNVGTVLRTAEAAGFGGAVLGDGCADPFSPKVVRSTMGSVFRLPIMYGQQLSISIAAYRRDGWRFAAAALSGEDFFGRDILYGNKFGLVIGNEGNGVSPEVLAACDLIYKLPMGGNAESLNAAVSAGIMMYDCFRRGDGRV